MTQLTLHINGQPQTLDVPPMRRLLDVLREDLHLTGTKEGCGEGECGACAVLLNGDLVNSCLIPALQAQNADLITIEGVSTAGHLHPIQQCFLECGGAQCGICTPGMILATQHLLDRHPNPTLAQIQEGLAGNLCRCTGYMRVFEAVQQAAQNLARQESEGHGFSRAAPTAPTPAALAAEETRHQPPARHDSEGHGFSRAVTTAPTSPASAAEGAH